MANNRIARNKVHDKTMVLAFDKDEFNEFLEIHKNDGKDYQFIRNKEMITDPGCILNMMLYGCWFLRSDYLYISEIIRQTGGKIIEA